jgi:non-specific serine/threonine protein kinase/serine/threonine-protein kinase
VIDSDAPTKGFSIDDSGQQTDIGPYRLIRQIGEGGMGIVYHAQQMQPIRRDVALKVIKPGMDTKQVITRFEAERQALAVMDHPHIARVFDAGTTTQGRPYFVMELVDGIPITQYCDSKRLNVRERIELFIPVCEAIQHAHQKGIIHRDIKPSNILITEHEGKPMPKVIDFGLAKALGQQLSDASMMTNVGVVVGTPDYMSPEQAELTRQDVDTRADVYSLGAVLYELLIGTTPLNRARLENAAYIDVLKTIREEQPAAPSVRLRQSSSAEVAAQRHTDPSRLPKLLRGELDWITMKALEKDRTRRYETVNGLARDLERYLAGDTVEAGPMSTTYRLRRFAGRHSLGLSMAAAFAVLLVAGVVVSSWEAVRARRAEQAALAAEQTAKAINDFLQNDLLAQASANQQARPDANPDPDLKVRTALDKAAMRIEGKFTGQPLVEASIRMTMGTTYRQLGLFAEAQRQLERALELRRHTLGERHVDTLASMDDLGDLYRLQGEYAQAEPLLIQASELGHDLMGEENPLNLDILDSLGTVYLYEGKLVQAEPLLTRVVQIRARVLGEDHPDTLISKNNLALLVYRRGKYPDAERLLVAALESRRRVMGAEHPDTLKLTNNLAMTYRAERKYTQAEALLSGNLETERRVLGEEHPDTLRSMNNLALVLWDEHDYARAAPLLVSVLNVRRRVLGEGHPDTLNTLVSLGKIRLEQQKYPEAESLLRGALRIHEKIRSDSWQRFDCQSLLGGSLAAQKQYLEAEPLLVNGYDGLSQKRATIATEGQTALREAGERILKLYQDWGKPDKAAEWKKKLPQLSQQDSTKNGS